VYRLVIIGVIFLFAASSVIPISGFNLEQTSTVSSDGNTLYVGGSGDGNYTKIQDAIDDASDGNTVFVYNGTYYENVVINKSIDLIGEDKYNTRIRGKEKSVILITADDVFLCGFTVNIRDNGYGIVLNDANKCTLIDNIIQDNCEGIKINSSNNCIISGNILSGNYAEDIRLDESHNNIIVNNNIVAYDEYGSIALFNSHNNTVIFNDIKDAEYGSGIILGNAKGNTINSNNITTSEIGIYLYDNDDDNTIIKNNIFYCKYGIIVYWGSNKNILNSNTISSNRYGLNIEVSKKNIVTENNITNNSYGCSLYLSRYNIFKNNNFIGNTRHVYFGTSWLNKWNGNYWDNWIGLKINLPIFQKFPKIIIGWRGFNNFIPFYFNFDWNPAQEPYDI